MKDKISGYDYPRRVVIIESDTRKIKRIFSNKAKAWNYLNKVYCFIRREYPGEKTKPINNYNAFLQDMKIFDGLALSVMDLGLARGAASRKEIWVVEYTVD